MFQNNQVAGRRIILWASLLIGSALSVNAQGLVEAQNQEGLQKTISLEVSKFMDVRDKKLEDVMIKMPGLTSFNRNGALSFKYNGMDVYKIYVNGMDVLEDNNLPVYNMKPEDVERLEITENHLSIQVMQGKQFSNNALINVVLKDTAKDLWSGAVKGQTGGTPLLGMGDFNAMKVGQKTQTTILLKADNTGLDFSGSLKLAQKNDFFFMTPSTGLEGVGGNFDYSLLKALRVDPALAPLQSDRVRFNRSAIFNVGHTMRLSDNYQINSQLILHTNRLTASSLDDTTYFLDQGRQEQETAHENAQLHQNDLQMDVTLLANTSRIYLRNQLSLATQWNDGTKDVSGTFPNLTEVKSTPLELTNSFHMKTLLGQQVFSVDAKLGLLQNPQNLNIEREDGLFTQHIGGHSYYGDLGAKLDFDLKKGWNLSANAGASFNDRLTTTSMSAMAHHDWGNMDSKTTIWNGYAGTNLTYISDRMQAELKLPVIYGNYNVKDNRTQQESIRPQFYFSPSFMLKYDVTSDLSLTAEAELDSEEVTRNMLFTGLMFEDYRNAIHGLPVVRGDKDVDLRAKLMYKDVEHSFFVNAEISKAWRYKAFISSMTFDDDFIIEQYIRSPHNYHNSDAGLELDISKGITSFKGKVGLEMELSREDMSMNRNGTSIPFRASEMTISPYVNGRLSSWINVIYKLTFEKSNLKMKEEDTSSSSKEYTQSLELIVSPTPKMNFSLLGEHYYTEFSDDVSKHLVLTDLKAEYDLNARWQLLFTVRNLLNQRTYNYTMNDSFKFTKSFTSYNIRPRNILVGVYYKF